MTRLAPSTNIKAFLVVLDLPPLSNHTVCLPTLQSVEGSLLAVTLSFGYVPVKIIWLCTGFCGPGPKKKLTRFFSLRKRVCAKCIAANLVSARPHIVLKKIPFASEEVLPLVMLSDKDSHGNSLVTVYPSTYDDAGIETLEIHSNYHWIPHIPAMMRELSEDYEEVFFGSTRSTVSHATQHRYDAFVKEREKYIEDELKHAYKCILWENNMDWDYDDY
ncbi:hypothetical protein CPB85DRAFT_698195 [Mucidula mucida]|nr:hypothetical protein CPB85DRAFT_698195 [Mucidula mucida]